MRITEYNYYNLDLNIIKRKEPEDNIVVLSSEEDDDDANKGQRKFLMLKNRDKNKGNHLDFSA